MKVGIVELWIALAVGVGEDFCVHMTVQVAETETGVFANPSTWMRVVVCVTSSKSLPSARQLFLKRLKSLSISLVTDSSAAGTSSEPDTACLASRMTVPYQGSSGEMVFGLQLTTGSAACAETAAANATTNAVRRERNRFMFPPEPQEFRLKLTGDPIRGKDRFLLSESVTVAVFPASNSYDFRVSVLYLIDAYNVIRSDERMSEGTLQQQRERLLRFIEERRPGGNNEVVVVFDGKPGRDWNGWRGPTRIVFSEDRDADSEIKERVDGMKNPAAAVVVTNDRAIEKWVRGAGARVVSCGEFLRSGARAARNPSSGKPDVAAQEEINRHMKKIWKLE